MAATTINFYPATVLTAKVHLNGGKQQIHRKKNGIKSIVQKLTVAYIAGFIKSTILIVEFVVNLLSNF
jgi:hypothetical protein